MQGGTDEQRLPRTERLGSRARIQELFDRGRVGKSRTVLVRILENGLPQSRIVITVGRKVGNAVTRNRIRRRLRAAWRMGKSGLPAGMDVVILPRYGLLDQPFGELQDALGKAMARALEDKA